MPITCKEFTIGVAVSTAEAFGLLMMAGVGANVLSDVADQLNPFSKVIFLVAGYAMYKAGSEMGMQYHGGAGLYAQREGQGQHLLNQQPEGQVQNYQSPELPV